MTSSRLVVGLCAMAASIAGAPSIAAQGVMHVTPSEVRVEIPLGRGAREQWRWNEPGTPDGQAEYMWSARPEGDSTYAIGFTLFKFPGASFAEGTFTELLRAGQAAAWQVTGHRERLLPDVRVTARGADSVLVVTLRHPRLVAEMFARRPQHAVILTKTPYAESARQRIAIIYDGF